MNRVIRTDTHRERDRELRTPPRGYDLGHRRDRRGPWLVGAGLVIVAAGGVFAVRTLGAARHRLQPRPRAAHRGRCHACSSPRPMTPSVPGFVSTLRGLVDNTSALSANGAPVALEPGGAFTIYIPQGTTEVRLVAQDAVGATTETVVAVTATPVPTTYPATSAVHVTAAGWADPVIRQQIVDLAASRPHQRRRARRQGRGRQRSDTPARCPLATTAGAGRRPLRRPPGPRRAARARRARDRSHRLLPRPGAGGVGVGRTADRTWSSSTAPVPRRWPTTTARRRSATWPAQRSASTRSTWRSRRPRSGFDEILYDYVRRPEGSARHDAVHRARHGAGRLDRPLRRRHRRPPEPTRARSSASRCSASRRPGPSRRPRTSTSSPRTSTTCRRWCTRRTVGLGRVRRRRPAAPAGRHRRPLGRRLRTPRRRQRHAVVPWLQDFSSGDVVYGPAEVRAQIDAALATGVGGVPALEPQRRRTRSTPSSAAG